MSRFALVVWCALAAAHIPYGGYALTCTLPIFLSIATPTQTSSPTPTPIPTYIQKLEWLQLQNGPMQYPTCSKFEGCFGRMIPLHFLGGCAPDGCKLMSSLDEAMEACFQMPLTSCGGVVEVYNMENGQTVLPSMFELRRGTIPRRSMLGENSFVRLPPPTHCDGAKNFGDTAPKYSQNLYPPSVPPPVPPVTSDKTSDPYDVLQISRDATQGEIRRAYRKLAAKFHPDQNPNDPEVAKKFVAIGDAYNVLGDPDKRSAFDDFGLHNDNGFDTYWQYQQSNRKSTKDFYVGDQLVQRLTDDNWDRRTASGNWIVEFYAPWCRHCVESTGAFKAAADLLDGTMEFGAVNGVSNRELVNRFAVKAYPSIFIFSAEYQMHSRFPWDGPTDLGEKLQSWSSETISEWDRLYRGSTMERLDSVKFMSYLLESDEPWIVMFIYGKHCARCDDARANFYRFSVDLAGSARTAELDCQQNERVCKSQGVPSLRYPHFFLFPSGNKAVEGPAGEPLFVLEEVSAHVAFPMVARVLRATQNRSGDSTSLGLPPSEMGYNKPPAPQPPPTPIRYSPPPPTPRHIRIGTSGQRRYRLA